MDKAAVIKIISDFKDTLEKKEIHVNKMVLFGSYATGNNMPDSDIDLAVISDDFKGKDYWERINLLSEVIYELFQPIEASAFTSEEWNAKTSIIARYAEEGELIFS
jgi:uncharacterized protein